LYNQIKEFRKKKQNDYLNIQNLNQQNEYLKEKVEILQSLGNEKVLECIKQQKKILEYEQELEILRTTVSKLSNNFLVQENAEIRELLELYQTQQTEKDKELLHREEEIKKYILKMQETLTSREKEMNKLKEEIQREQKKIQIYFQTKEELHQEKLQELEDLKYDFLLQKNLLEEEKKTFYIEREEAEKKKENVEELRKEKKNTKKVQVSKLVSSVSTPEIPSSPLLKIVPTMTPITLIGDSEFGNVVSSPRPKSDTSTDSTAPLSPKRKISSTSIHFAALRDLYENKSRTNSPRGTESPRRKMSMNSTSFKDSDTKTKKKSLELNLKSVDLNINTEFNTTNNMVSKTPRIVPTNTSSLLQKFYKGIKDEKLDLSKTKLSSIEIHQLCVALQDNTSVKYLNLESTGINNKNLNHVAMMLSKNKSIVELNLAGNEISNWNLISNALLNNQTICKIDFGNVNEKDVQLVELIQDKLISKE
jgi:hypothetical protein